jgi:hypothetical protein
MAQQEMHLELLLSKRVVDANAQLAGRIEEVCAEQQGEETVIQAYLLGPDALAARLAVWLTGLRLLHWLGVEQSNRGGYRVPWDKMDLTEPEQPRLRCAKEELERLEA